MSLRRIAGWVMIGVAGVCLSSVSASAQRRGAVTRAELDALKRELEEQRKMLAKIIVLQQQFTQALIDLLPDGQKVAGASGSQSPSAETKTEPSGPKTKPVQTGKGAEPVASERRTKPSKTAQRGTLVGRVQVSGGRAGNVFVYVEDIRDPPLRATKSVLQKNKAFSPGVLVVRRGTRVSFPNRDPFFHNVFSVTPGAMFDLGSYPKGETRGVKMTRPGPVSVYCNMHPQMVAHVLVVPNRYYTRAGSDGLFRIPNVPAGSHRVAAWTPYGKPVVRKVAVSPGEITKVDLTLKRGRPSRHLKKDGTPYGSYD